MPDVVARSVDPMAMKIRKEGIVAVAVKSFFRFPLYKDQDLSRLDASSRRLSELAKRDHAPAVSLNLIADRREYAMYSSLFETSNRFRAYTCCDMGSPAG